MSFEDRGKGAHLPTRWPTVAELDAHANRMRFASSSAVRGPVILGVPDIRDQLGTNSCFAFATCQAVHIRRQVLGIPSSLLSPMVPYFEARRLLVGNDGDIRDDGSDPYGMMTAWADFGACPWDFAPFDPANINARPGLIAMQEAQKVQCTIEPILETGQRLWAAIQHAVGVEKKPVIHALEVTEAFRHPLNGIVDSDAGENEGLHANIFYGINDDGGINANSWGTGYGSNGSVVLTPRFIAKRIVWAAVLTLESELQEAA